MYNYLLNVTAANRNTKFDEELINALKQACEDANTTTNSTRYGRNFLFVKIVDEKIVQIRLKSKTATVATRAISSITRALIRICPKEKLEPLKYGSSILAATVVEDSEEGAEVYANLEPFEVVQAVVEIFFGQTTAGNNDKRAAKRAADQIKDIVAEYKAFVRK